MTNGAHSLYAECVRIEYLILLCHGNNGYIKMYVHCLNMNALILGVGVVSEYRH
jgi:hypothetical protein